MKKYIFQIGGVVRWVSEDRAKAMSAAKQVARAYRVLENITGCGPGPHVGVYEMPENSNYPYADARCIYENQR